MPSATELLVAVARLALLVACVCLLGICLGLLDFAADHGFPNAGRHRAAEGLNPDAEPVGAADDDEVLHI